MWLACHTQEEIAAAVEVPQQTIADWMKDFTEKSASDISVFPADFEVPIYNVWKQQTKTAGVNHFGNSEVRFVTDRPICDEITRARVEAGDHFDLLPLCTELHPRARGGRVLAG
jgi:hypothetical protein